MTVYATSDLHYGHSMKGDRAVCALAKHLSRVGQENDQLLIGGDLAVDDGSILECLNLFKSFPGSRMAVAGNHDIWVNPDEKRNSWERYEGLSDIFRTANFHSLEDAPLCIGDRAFVGTIGWYDYSFMDDIGVSLEDYERKESERVRGGWRDAKYVRLPFDDNAMTEKMVNRLLAQLESVRGAREVIVLTHHLVTKKLLFHPRWLVPMRWRFMNAFLGSSSIGRVITRFGNVRRVICGHLHFHKTVRENDVEITSVGGDYEAKMLLAIDGYSVQSSVFTS